MLAVLLPSAAVTLSFAAEKMEGEKKGSKFIKEHSARSLLTKNYYTIGIAICSYDKKPELRRYGRGKKKCI